MKRSNRLLLIVGVLLAALAFVAVLLLGNRPAPDVAEPPTVTVVVAATDIPLGTQLTADMLATAERPEVQAEGSKATIEELVGQVVRRNVVSGQILRDSDFEADEAAEIAGAIPTGQRAMAIALDKVGSVGYLIQPGDTVDVVLAVRDGDGLDPVVGPVDQGVDDDEPFDPNDTTTYGNWDEFTNTTTVKVLVENVQVLSILRTQAVTDAATPVDQDDPYWVAVVAVSPQDAELVRFAQLDGNVSLLLRSPGDRDAGPAGTAGVTLRRLVEEFGVLPPGPVTSQPIVPQEPFVP